MANEFVLRKGLISLGAVTVPITGVTGVYTVTENDFTVEAISGSFAITLPDAALYKGKLYDIKNSGGGVININTNGGNIDGVSSKTLNQYGNLFVQSNGTNWILVGADGTSGTSGS